MTLKLIHKKTKGLLLSSIGLICLQAETIPSQESTLTQSESSGQTVSVVDSLVLPPDILIAVSNPASYQSLSVSESALPDLTLSFVLGAQDAPMESAETFLQGSGIALALVTLPEGEALAAFDPDQGTDGDWLYGLVPASDTVGHFIAITFSSDAQSWRVSVNGQSLFTDLPRDLLTLADPLTFYGSTTDDVSITSLAGTYPVEEEAVEDTERAKYKSNLAKAKTLRDMKWKPWRRLFKSNGTWEYGENLFAQKLARLPDEVLDAPIESLVFVDNLDGNDRNNGHFPVHVNGKNGPVASMKQALELSGEGKILIFLPGDGYYAYDDIIAKPGTKMITTVGHLTLAATSKEER
ncbi:hypothetical protein [Rubellicoccus peritrichatus]|uniref:Uncharacterized protein n=1 Tax=Rubellicoccus peritrichatus TaxID=3080537 RepID=A0AAQ3QW42_9BACT|nr:hypothetical protein [Puniceicoccus sp. CR14]WOO41507.1 hypothetical protein RZN69_00300 [Puniceicoccus sp. CR14]